MPVAPITLSPPAIALNRFGLGARPGDPLPANAQRWVMDQFAHFDVRPAGFAALADSTDILRRYQDERRDRRLARRATEQGGATAAAAFPGQSAAAPGDVSVAPAAAKLARDPMRQKVRQEARALYRAAVQARAENAIATDAPFVERMVHFWSNHFAVSADNLRVAAYAGAFERDAIRPHVLGRFEDMLLAVEHHPAMLIYLNQTGSIGPDSRAALRTQARKRGLNENLAREIMELHTLGVRSGYAQADVTELARALTGWSVDLNGRAGDGGNFAFRPAQHQPGGRAILGRRFDQDGEAQGRAALLTFANDPRTATHIATKIARHFAGDVPPPALVVRLAKVFTQSRGDLPSLYRTLIASPEVWAPTPVKFKSPWEWAVSAWRAVGPQAAPRQAAAVLDQLGQPVWKPGSPAGWDDLASTWAAPDALMRRVEVAARLTSPLGDKVDARLLGPKLLPASYSPATAEQVARSESPAGALALLLASPDFLRR